MTDKICPECKDPECDFECLLWKEAESWKHCKECEPPKGFVLVCCSCGCHEE